MNSQVFSTEATVTGSDQVLRRSLELNPKYNIADVPRDLHQRRKLGLPVLDVSYRGATSILLALLGRLEGPDQKVLMLDSFSGMPRPSGHDAGREGGEYAPPAGWVETILERGSRLTSRSQKKPRDPVSRRVFGLIDSLTRTACDRHHE